MALVGERGAGGESHRSLPLTWYQTREVDSALVDQNSIYLHYIYMLVVMMCFPLTSRWLGSSGERQWQISFGSERMRGDLEKSYVEFNPHTST